MWQVKVRKSRTFLKFQRSTKKSSPFLTKNKDGKIEPLNIFSKKMRSDSFVKY